MSIKIESVTKFYGTQKALDNLSFEINKGELIGFLGPNGAGKSTLMKIITGFLPASSGTVSIDDVQITVENPEIRAKIGYLPENNPLYMDMYVKEYLRFVAGIYKIANPWKRIDQMIEETGLQPECHKKIGALSKGYRQRVGLAQALIHNPEVLILDEPTSGLDPNQLEEIRVLIKAISREKTVMLSTHIMQEVQAICQRVIVINQGQLVADSSIHDLTERFSSEVPRIFVEFDTVVDPDLIRSISGVTDIEVVADGKSLIITAKNDCRKELFNLAANHNLTILSLREQEQSLENIFHELTR